MKKKPIDRLNIFISSSRVLMAKKQHQDINYLVQKEIQKTVGLMNMNDYAIFASKITIEYSIFIVLHKSIEKVDLPNSFCLNQNYEYVII